MHTFALAVFFEKYLSRTRFITMKIKRVLFFPALMFLVFWMKAQSNLKTLDKPVFTPQPNGFVFIPGPESKSGESLCCAFFYSKGPVTVKEFREFISDLRARSKYDEAITAELAMIENKKNKNVLLLKSTRILNLYCSWLAEKRTAKKPKMDIRLSKLEETKQAYRTTKENSGKSSFGLNLPKIGSHQWVIIEGRPTLIVYPSYQILKEPDQGEIRLLFVY